MKTTLTFILLLAALSLFPGCYTVLLVEDTDEVATSELTPSFHPIVEYIPVYYPEPIPAPGLPTGGHRPIPPPEPTPYFPPSVYVVNNPPSTPPPSSDTHREIRTGRGPLDSNPAPVGNDDDNKETRDPRSQRTGR